MKLVPDAGNPTPVQITQPGWWLVSTNPTSRYRNGLVGVVRFNTAGVNPSLTSATFIGTTVQDLEQNLPSIAQIRSPVLADMYSATGQWSQLIGAAVRRGGVLRNPLNYSEATGNNDLIDASALLGGAAGVIASTAADAAAAGTAAAGAAGADAAAAGTGAGAGGIAGKVASGVGKVLSSTGGKVATAAALAWLTTPSTWLRIAELVGGAVLMFVAIKALTGVQTPSLTKAL